MRRNLVFQTLVVMAIWGVAGVVIAAQVVPKAKRVQPNIGAKHLTSDTLSVACRDGAKPRYMELGNVAILSCKPLP